MKKLNNKGLTAIEVLISFTIASIIIISMFKVLNVFEQKEEVVSVKTAVTSYKNQVNKSIMDDIIKCGGLNNVEVDKEEVVGDAHSKKATLMFKKTDGNCLPKDIKIQQDSNGDASYIKYGSERFNMPKVLNLKFTESDIIQREGFVEFRVSFHHPDIGNQFDAIKIILPLESYYSRVY